MQDSQAAGGDAPTDRELAALAEKIDTNVHRMDESQRIDPSTMDLVLSGSCGDGEASTWANVRPERSLFTKADLDHAATAMRSRCVEKVKVFENDWLVASRAEGCTDERSNNLYERVIAARAIAIELEAVTLEQQQEKQ